MTRREFLATGLGHAIMDISARADDAFIAESGLTRGGMTLIGAAEARSLQARLEGRGSFAAGGSASNTIADLSDQGARCGFVGSCATDARGEAYHYDMLSRGIAMPPPAERPPPATGCSVVLVSPDGERTMATNLGAAAAMDAGHVDADLICRSDWLFVEGYLFDLADSDSVLAAAMEPQRCSGGKIGLSLSDVSCVERCRSRIERCVADSIDLVIGNVGEVRALFPDRTTDQAIAMLAAAVPTLAVTQGPHEAIIVDHGNYWRVPASVCAVVDTTGAGDCFAAGFLFALSQGMDAGSGAVMGHARAALCVGREGARSAPKSSLPLTP